jgi:hypothetical protein
MEIFYDIPCPDVGECRLNVYGDTACSASWFEWRLVRGGCVLVDSSDFGYFSPESALRDGLLASLLFNEISDKGRLIEKVCNLKSVFFDRLRSSESGRGSKASELDAVSSFNFCLEE